MKRIIIFTTGMIYAVLSYAQTTVTVGAGTGTSSVMPINAYYGYSYSQTIYHADEIHAAGGDVGSITNVRFYYNNGGTQNSNNWTVYIGHTSANVFNSNTDWIPLANLTQVFSGTVTFPAAGNWLDVTLTTPFTWNGFDNLVIAIDENQPGYSSGSCYWNSTNAGENRAIYYYNDSNNPNPASPPTGTRTTNYPNAQLVFNITNCAGAPNHYSAQASDDSVCVGAPVQFTLNNYDYLAGIQYTWQYDDGNGWTDFANSDNLSYTTTLAQTSDVRAVVTCSNTSQSDTSDAVTVVVNPQPAVSITPASYAVCTGGVASLTASGANSYTWAPATDLDNTASATVNSTPAASITYTVTGTSALGCTNTATVPVTLLTDMAANATMTPAQICQSGTPVNMDITGLPVAVSGGGSYEYRWLADDGTTVLQNWNASSSFQFTPPADDEYTLYYQIRSTSCTAETLDSVAVHFNVGFGADVTTQDYNCVHPEGIFTLTNIFGQYYTDTLYNNAFDSAGVLIFTGSASLNGGRAEITPSGTGLSGYMQLNYSPTLLGINNSMQVSFLLTADMPINNYGTGGGDGLTYSFGDDAMPASPGPAQNGKGSKLRLCFDAADNGTENGNAKGIYLVYGWTGSNAYGPGSAEVLAYSSNTTSWKLGTDVPVSLVIDELGKATVTVGGTVVMSDVQLPAAYTSADVTGWSHLVSAATGGDALRHAVDNLQITTSSLSYGIVPGSGSTPPSSWQATPVFNGLMPGDYSLWISNPANPSCSKDLGVFQIHDLNPVVDLGNDTTLCSGQSILLDAGNPGSTYLWSGVTDTTQMVTVSGSGTYGVSVTDTAGCMAIDNIHISTAPSPAADGIYASGMFPTVFLAVTNPQNATQYNWHFGDGNAQYNAPSTVGHTYATQGTYTVTVALSNTFGCDSTVLTKIINVNNTQLSLDENNLDGLQVYPNPAQDFVNVILPSYDNVVATVYTVSGAVVYKAPLIANRLDVQQWNNGVYFLKLEQEGKTTVTRIIVAR